jgi:hypothetical protein
MKLAALPYLLAKSGSEGKFDHEEGLILNKLSVRFIIQSNL